MSQTSIPAEILEQLINQGIYKHLKDSAMIAKVQHDFLKNGAC